PRVVWVGGGGALLGGAVGGGGGPRRPPPSGGGVTERLAADLAQAGVTIVSGMARGIDTAAHKGALAAGGTTIAVLGCGVDVVYPSENRKLAAEIADKGLLVSEFPMGTPAYPQNFPVRNRIISGVSAGVVVVEGAQYSGSAITAKLALDQGRELFAVPGNITSRMSWGPNLLIKQGARLVQDWNDVVAGLPARERRRLAERRRAEGGTATNGEGEAGALPVQGELPLGPMAPVARKLLDLLKVDAPTPIDQLLEQVEDVSSSELIAALFELEVLGLVKQMPGRNFVKAW
ncbi:MAG: DNA-processing protein DprA, partial [Bryobacteraceae bacterium]|nr:DNA-processing protein DprA [Bryobacteraceae bacterium]